MKFWLKVSVTLLTALICIDQYCQRPLNNYYSEFSGLVGSNVYGSIQDHEGYLWFSTSKGVSRYDGFEFVSYTTSEGLTDNDVLGMFEDREHRIWFKTFSGRPCFFQAGKIFNSTNCDFLKGVELTDLISSIFQDSKGKLWFGSKNEIITVDPKSADVASVKMRSQFFWEDSEGVKSFPGTDRFYNHTANVEILQNIDLDSFPWRVPELAYALQSGDLLVAKNSLLFLVTNQGRTYSVVQDLELENGNRILSLYQDSKKQIWIGTRNNLLKYDSIERLDEKPAIYLANCEVNSVLEDHEGSMWATTSTGLYQFESNRLTEFEWGKGDVTAIAVNGTELVVGYKHGEVQQIYFDSTSDQFVLGNKIKSGFFPREIKFFHDTCLIGSDVGLFVLNKGELKSTPITYSVKGFDYTNHNLISGTSYGALQMRLSALSELVGSKSIKNEKFFQERVYQFCRVEKHLFVTTKDKVYEWNGALKELNYFSEIIPHKITHLNRYKDYLVTGTESNGIYFISNGKIVEHYSKEHGLASNDVINTFVCHDVLYVATSEGISKLEGGQFQLIPETKSRQFKIREAELYENKILIGTSLGLVVLNLDLKNDFNIVPLVVLDVFAQNVDTSLLANAVLKYDENNLKFDFKRISYHAVTFNYKYRIVGLDETWNSTNERAVSYKNIPPGEYIFELDYGGKSLRQFAFTIEKPFWKKTGFVIGAILLALVLIALVYYYLLVKYKRKSQYEFGIKLSIAEAEQKALRAQMNPHFIFNALNAIQNFVLKKDTDNAYNYLGQFAKLIRATLENSRKMTNSISDEISFLKLYLNIESLRFKDQFQYEFVVNENVDQQQQIPSMVIQPFVENAIVHGLLPSKSAVVKRIVISITEDDRFIYFEILDNGSGLVEKEGKAKLDLQKESLGIGITKERISLYDPLMLSTVEVANVNIPNSDTTGVVVKIKIRKNV